MSDEKSRFPGTSRSTFYRQRKKKCLNPALVDSASDVDDLLDSDDENPPKFVRHSVSPSAENAHVDTSQTPNPSHFLVDTAGSPSVHQDDVPDQASSSSATDESPLQQPPPLQSPSPSLCADDEESDHEQDQPIEPEGDSDVHSEGTDLNDAVMLSDEEEIMNDNVHGGEPPGGDPPLYAGAPLTLGESLLVILTFSIVHKLTGVALADLLSLVALHCIDVNSHCMKSLYKFKKYFENLKSPVSYHYFCSNCQGPLTSNTDVCPNEQCANSKVSYFLEVSIFEQLSSMYRREEFLRQLNFRHDRVKKKAENYEDIYDGQLYKDKVESGFLSDPCNISFTWNTDGVKVFKSAKLELWPVYLAINELPYSIRFKKENMIIAGLWFGDTKPSPGLFLRSFHTEFENLYRGVNFVTPGGEIRVRATMLCGTCDTPAKSLFLNITAHNGYYGCPKCKIRGERSERTDFHHAYPCDLDKNPRTDEETREHAELAERHGSPFYGIKGFSAFRFYVNNYIVSTAVDLMHCAYLGVVKTLMDLWFDTKFSEYNFSLSNVVSDVSKTLEQITPPSYVPRMPRSITEHLSYWKASEFKVWLYYYSVPILFRVMQPEYLQHHLLLVKGLFLLNMESISINDINEAEECLKQYVVKFEHLYGLRFLSINFHLLLHLAENVRNLGPLWVSSCMPFEDINGQLVGLVHGTRYADLQITSGLSQLVNLPILLTRLRPENGIRRWCETLHKRAKLAITETIDTDVCTVGKYVRLVQIPPMIQDALLEAEVGPGNVCQFFKLKKGKYIYCSEAYSRTTKTSSFTVEYLWGDVVKIGIINSFARISDCECAVVCRCRAEFYAFILVLRYQCPFKRASHPRTQLSHVCDATRANQMVAVKVENLRSLCFQVCVGDKMYVCRPVNQLEDE